MVAAISRVASTLPQQVRERLNFGNGEPQVLQVLGADTRRNDGVFFCNGKVYGAEFKRGMIEPHHLYETLVERRYSLILKAKYGNDFAGIVFVGETICEGIESNSDTVKTWKELTQCGIATQSIGEFARSIITMAIREIASNPQAFSTYTLTQFPSHLHALTTKSDGYPMWFDETWLKNAYWQFSRSLTDGVL
jgi:hypothetical protein